MTGGSARSVGARATRLREQAGAREELGRGVGCWRGREREGVETGWAAGVDVGRVGLGLLGWGFPSGLVWVSRFGLCWLYISHFLFLKPTITQLGEFKFKFEFTTSTQTIN